MSQAGNLTTDVLIVGAGPAGLMMACQLAVHGIPFRIIDKNSSSSVNSGALIVQARTLEIFEQMGIAKIALSQGVIAERINIIYNGKKISSTGIQNLGGNLSKFPYLLMLEQSQTEKLLLNFIGERGHTVEREVELQSFSQQDERVTSKITLSDNSEQVICSKYIIAADGANSSIRQMLHIPFLGKSYPNPIFIIDCEAESELIPGEISFAFSGSSVTGFFPIKGSRWRIDSNLPTAYDNRSKLTFEVIEQNFKTWTRMNIDFQSQQWFSVTRSSQKQAENIRSQNCFLIGDSAHVHTPVGAQGMNTGLQDAFNLGWKMAFVIKQKAAPSILDSYTSERLGISKGFARYADLAFKVLTSNSKTVKFLRLSFLRLFFTFLFPFISGLKNFRLGFFRSISQINLNYRKSILSHHEFGFHFLHHSPCPGDRLPYFDLVDAEKPSSIFEKLNSESFNLIVLADSLTNELKEIADQFNLSILLIPNNSSNAGIYTLLGIKKTGYFLIRPDMYISLISRNTGLSYLKKFITQIALNAHNNK
jgi:2-polyprenyl-6-methoxyphenol hydroxylase-like FAD-dependent oxidoreductase